MENYENIEKNITKNKKIKIFFICIAVLVIGVFVVAGCMFFIEKFSRDESEKILDKISNMMILPDEIPIINTIEDAEGLRKESPFYENIQEGDKILIYAESAKVIIYREKENKIINVGPIINDTEE